MVTVAILAMNPAVDVFFSVRQIVTGRKLRCRSVERQPGGGGVTVARAFHSLGGDAVLIHLCGGGTGETLRETLDREGVRHVPITISGDIRENIVIREEVTGEQLRIVLPGPAVTEEEWRAALRAVEALSPAPRYVVASGSLPPGVPPDFYARLARTATERGARLLLDTSGEALRRAVGEGVFLLKPNLRELGKLAGAEVTDRSEQELVARRVVEEGGCEVLVLSLGGAGVLTATRDGLERFRAPTVPIRSKIGAGDSMVAGIVLALTEGKTVREAILFGIASGASAVMAPGTGLCCRDDTLRLYASLLEEFPLR